MEMQGVAFRYTRRAPYVLADVDLAVEPGNIVEVTGRNGTGKSTLLKLSAGVLLPTRGAVRWGPRRVGYAPERFPAGQAFTMASYLAHMGRLHGVDSGRARQDVRAWAQRLGCEHLLNTPLGELSKGSAQKVGVIGALLPGPDLLVLDEPFASFDVGAKQELALIAMETAARGGIVLVSDHQSCLGEWTGRTLWHLDSGSVVVAAGDDRGAVPAASPVETVTLEVTVRATEADTLAARLKTEGYRVRDRSSAASETERQS